MTEQQKSLSRLQTFYGHLDDEALLAAMIHDEFKERVALVSSFGAGSALLLALVAKVDPSTPILFLETKKHFDETLTYIETLKNTLGLTHIRMLEPDTDALTRIDQDGTLWKNQPNRCCHIRKVAPLKAALDTGEFDAIITGRKRYQTKQRAEMDVIELAEDGIFRINPLGRWSKERVADMTKDLSVPEHPLVAKGYLSIGCAPCTQPVQEGQDERAGRWAHTAELPGGEQKVECGIHIEGEKPSRPEWSI